MSAAHLSPQRRLTHNRGEEVLRGSQLSQSRNRGSLQKPHPFSFLTLGGSRCGQPCPTWAPPLLSVMSPERQLGGSNQLLSRPWRTAPPPPPPSNPAPRWAESLGLAILSDQMWIWVLILFSFFPLRSKSFKSFFLLPQEEKHMGLSGWGFSAPSCCSQAPEARPQSQICLQP